MSDEGRRAADPSPFEETGTEIRCGILPGCLQRTSLPNAAHPCQTSDASTAVRHRIRRQAYRLHDGSGVGRRFHHEGILLP